MKRIVLCVLSLCFAGAIAFAHGDNDHVRGVVTQISATSVTVQTTDKATKTLAITATTKFQKSGASATAADLKVGDRVVIDVPKGKSEASIINFGPPKKAATHKS